MTTERDWLESEEFEDLTERLAASRLRKEWDVGLAKFRTEIRKHFVPRESWIRLNDLCAYQVKELELLVKPPTSPIGKHRAFMDLPIEERRRIMAEQAKDLAEYYETDPEARELLK